MLHQWFLTNVSRAIIWQRSEIFIRSCSIPGSFLLIAIWGRDRLRRFILNDDFWTIYAWWNRGLSRLRLCWLIFISSRCRTLLSIRGFCCTFWLRSRGDVGWDRKNGDLPWSLCLLFFLRFIDRWLVLFLRNLFCILFFIRCSMFRGGVFTDRGCLLFRWGLSTRRICFRSFGIAS